LLAELQKLYPDGLPKGFADDAPIIYLRALWAIGMANSYQKTAITADKSFWKALEKTLDKAWQDINQNAKTIKKEFRELNKSLNKIAAQISQEPIISLKQENQLREQLKAMQAKAPAAQPAPTP
jgi:hypothetical protein